MTSNLNGVMTADPRYIYAVAKPLVKFLVFEMREVCLVRNE